MDYLYDWIQNLSFYMILMTAIIQMIPSEAYKKYIQFYMGLVIVLMLCTPIIKIIGMEKKFLSIYHSNAYRMEFNELIEKTQRSVYSYT